MSYEKKFNESFCRITKGVVDMKKNWAGFLALIAVVGMISACSKDDDNNNKCQESQIMSSSSDLRVMWQGGQYVVYNSRGGSYTLNNQEASQGYFVDPCTSQTVYLDRAWGQDGRPGNGWHHHHDGYFDGNPYTGRAYDQDRKADQLDDLHSGSPDDRGDRDRH
jgi:hypothetical protein